MKKKKLRICILGSTMIADSAINSLINNKIKPELILTNKKDGYNSDWIDFKKKYKSINCHSLKPKNEKKIISLLKNNKINLLFCIGWSHILSKKIINIPNLLVIGHHPTDLPNNRGKHPLIWSIFLGLKFTASTFFIMDAGIDTGKIISQNKIKIKNNLPVKNLYKKVQANIKFQIIKVVRIVVDKNYIQTYSKFNKNYKRKRVLGNYWRRRNDLDGKIDFRMNSLSIFKLVNSLSDPYAGAHVEIKGKKYKVWKVKINKHYKKKNIEPGKIINKNRKLLTVKTYDSAIDLHSHEILIEKGAKYLI